MLSYMKDLGLRLKKMSIGVLALVLVTLFSMSNTCDAADYDWIKVYPEHIGIFTSVGVQQFVAFGYKNDGTRENITRKVDWISSNKNVISIDKNGLATIVTGITSGQVKITCSYPKSGNVSPGVLLLLKTNRYTVTPSAGANGTIAPSAAQTVNKGATTSFTVTPDAGYTASVGGTCGGTLVGTTYTTNAITGDCTVDATFAINTYNVTPSKTGNGVIQPSMVQTVDYNTTVSFTLTPDPTFSLIDVTGTCPAGAAPTDNGDGTWGYTTGAVTADCTVVANFTN